MIVLVKKYALPMFSGLVLAFCFPTFHWYPLAWAALVPLLWQCARGSVWSVSSRFFVAGWVFHSVLLQWLAANIFWAGGWALVGQQLLCICLALYWAALGAVWSWVRRAAPGTLWSGPLSFAALWFTMEWLQARLFTGFGWSALGYSQGPDLVLLQWASIGGVSLVSFLVVLTNALVALALTEPVGRGKRLLAAALVVALSHGLGALMLGRPDPAVEPLQVGIYQSNYPQGMKWDPEFTEDMVRRAAAHSRTLAERTQVDFFVWPEALVMDHYEHPNLKQWLLEVTLKTGTPLFTGTVRQDRAARKSYNSSVLIGADGEVVDYYDKVHLAPFGEYVPLEKQLPFLKGIVLGSVDAGAEQKVLPLGERNIGPLICFEVLFTPMAERLRSLGADMLVVVTNLGWFGASNAAAQELEVARLRAIETRLPLVHAGNTGISGVFDPWGRFRPVQGYFGYGGNFSLWTGDPVPPRAILMQRRMDALPVVAPGRRLIPHGPVIMPWIAVGVAMLFLVMAVIMPEGLSGPAPATVPTAGHVEDDASDPDADGDP